MKPKSRWKAILDAGMRVATDGKLQRELRRYAYAVEIAKADPIEAMHGHYCGPGCFHVALLSTEEKQALMKRRGWTDWPSVVMQRYDEEHSEV